MPIPLFTLKEDMSMYEEFKFLDAWAKWDIPEEQQLAWVREFFVHQDDMEGVIDGVGKWAGTRIQFINCRSGLRAVARVYSG